MFSGWIAGDTSFSSVLFLLLIPLVFHVASRELEAPCVSDESTGV